MTRHSPSQKHSAGQKHDHAPRKRMPHKDWRLWAVVGLMLAAMLGYIMSMDEAIEPGGNDDGQRMPAAP